MTRTLPRTDLYGALHKRARARGVAVHHGHRLVDAHESAGEVVAVFEDGSIVAGDVLVGADGLRSRVRQLIDPGAPRPRDAGLGSIGGVARAVNAVEPTGGDYVMTWGRRCFFGSIGSSTPGPEPSAPPAPSSGTYQLVSPPGSPPPAPPSPPVGSGCGGAAPPPAEPSSTASSASHGHDHRWRVG